MSVECEIEFENSPSKVVFAGQTVRGHVIVNVQKETSIRGVYLQLYGEGRCKFFSGAGKIKLVINNYEKYLDEKIVCFEGIGEKTPLEVGTHRYPFECELPTTIPTSLEEWFGHIRYTASIRFNESKDVKPIHVEIFTVIKSLDLNLLPHLKAPLLLERKEKLPFCCCLPCCLSGDLQMVIGSVQQGYVPGQKIELQLDISNNSRVNIKGIDTKLIKEVRFSSESENFIRRDLTTIATQRHTGFNAAREKTKTYRITVAVPPTPPTEEEAGDVIKVLYKIEVKAVLGWCRRNLKVDVPITIGTSPITKVNKDNVDTSPSAKKSDTDTDHAVTPAPPPEFDPPTFEEKVMDSGSEKTNTSRYFKHYGADFKPKYPVYRQSSKLIHYKISYVVRKKSEKSEESRF